MKQYIEEYAPWSVVVPWTLCNVGIYLIGGIGWAWVSNCVWIAGLAWYVFYYRRR